jgi:DNA-binding GntR family transcriptional regulator
MQDRPSASPDRPLPEAPRLGPIRSPSLAEQAADAIVAGVASGVLKPGERLVEAELASMLQMSRVPLREALKILEAQGIVESVPHRGTRIAAFDDRKVIQICEARIALERIALADAAPRYRSERDLIARLDRIVERMERAAEHLDWNEVGRCDLEFHREICRASGNRIISTLWETLARHVMIIFGNELRDERDARIVGRQHRRLRDLLAQGDTLALSQEIEQHIMRLRRPRSRSRGASAG